MHCLVCRVPDSEFPVALRAMSRVLHSTVIPGYASFYLVLSDSGSFACIHMASPARHQFHQLVNLDHRHEMQNDMQHVDS